MRFGSMLPPPGPPPEATVLQKIGVNTYAVSSHRTINVLSNPPSNAPDPAMPKFMPAPNNIRYSLDFGGMARVRRSETGLGLAKEQAYYQSGWAELLMVWYLQGSYQMNTISYYVRADD